MGGAGEGGPSREPRRAAWSRGRLRLLIARGLVTAGAMLGVLGVVTARWGLLVAGLVLVGLGAAAGPGRSRS